MSRVGKLPIGIPDSVKVDINGLLVKIEGKGGKLEKSFAGDIEIKHEDGKITVKPLNENKETKAMWGTARSIINGMVVGVTEGFKETLEVKGVGYRAIVKGSFLNLTLGKSHNTKIEIPSGITVVAPKQDLVELSCSDKQKLGQFVAVIKNQRPPEPYKGKGIKKAGEYIIRKEGKKG